MGLGVDYQISSAAGTPWSVEADHGTIVPRAPSGKEGTMFEGFMLERVDVGQATLRVRHGGSGPAVLLLHGHPRTHATWSRVAPLLADGYAVVCPDLRGYGESSKPPTTPDHQ